MKEPKWLLNYHPLEDAMWGYSKLQFKFLLETLQILYQVGKSNF